MNVIYAHEHPETLPLKSIFLAGPSPRGNEDYNWRPEALEILSGIFDGTVYVPLPRNGVWSSNYIGQVEWELQYIDAAKVVAFWVPRHVEELPGFTTNVEFGYLVKDAGKVVLGYPPNAHKMKYLHHVATKFHAPIRHTLAETLQIAVELANLVIEPQPVPTHNDDAARDALCEVLECPLHEGREIQKLLAEKGFYITSMGHWENWQIKRAERQAEEIARFFASLPDE